ncbi:hypothetical protein J6590_035467 [Homalodisca vitripennis]|nr:hypothetical protein J6590_035467 [Homalodisca vitripennis]
MKKVQPKSCLKSNPGVVTVQDGNYAERAGAGAPVYLAAVMEYLAAEVGITEFEDIGNFELTIKEIRHCSDWILSFSFVIYVLDLYTVFRAISDRMYTEHILKMKSVPFEGLSLLTFGLQQAST